MNESQKRYIDLGDSLYSALIAVPAIKDVDNRDTLLRHFDNERVLHISRSSAPATDLQNIIHAVTSWGKVEGDQLGLSILASNARRFAQGTALSGELEAIITTLDGFELEGVIDQWFVIGPRNPNLPIFKVPFAYNHDFTGRESYLKMLEIQLKAGEDIALTQPQAIHGLGGIGKTQLALKYAYDHRDDYQVVYWLSSEEETTLASEFAGLAEWLNLPQKDEQDQDKVIEAVKMWLTQNDNWLLIFDNATEQKVIEPYLVSQGHNIITSRNPVWPGARPLSIGTMNATEAFAFLVQVTGQTDTENIQKLAELLGYLPLALAQAGAYITKTGRTVADYLRLFESRRTTLLGKGLDTDSYPDSVATTWSLSFELLEEESPISLDLLNLFAFFAPEDIKLSFLIEATEHLPENLAKVVRDELEFDEALLGLQGYGLIDREGDAVNIHRLVQAVVQDQLSQEQQRQWVTMAMDCLVEAIPEGNIETDLSTWPEYGELLPHLIAVTDYGKKLDITDENTAELLSEIANYFYIRGQYKRAVAFGERALVITEQVHGPEHPSTGTRLNNLALFLKDQGDYAGAKPLYERALAIAEKVEGPEHLDTGSRLNNLADLLYTQGDYAGAKPLLERALAITEKALGPEHPSIGIRLSNLAMLLYTQGDYAGAKPLLEQSLAITEKALGPEHPSIGISLNNLAELLYRQGDYAGAKPLLEQSLAITEKALGPEHPDTGIRLNNLSMLFQAQGDYEGAKALFERALAIFEKVLGLEHPYTQQTRTNYEDLLTEMND